MATFQVHPHFGYLNSDVRLINNSNSPLLVKDVVMNKDYQIPAASNITVRLTAGEHQFVVVDNELVSETVVVEDAIKLGGSKEKKTYVYEETPWAVMVMLDRTYFFNRETKEQYVEHGLAPKSIRFLTSDYLLFNSDNDYSIFSLKSLSVAKTIGDAAFLYSNSQIAVFSIPNNLILYSLDEEIEEKVVKIDCNDYAIDETRQILFYHQNDQKEVRIKQLNAPGSNDALYRLSESFRCFIGNHSVVFGTTPQYLSVLDLNTKESAPLYNAIVPVMSVNGKEIWYNEAAHSILNSDVSDSFTSYVDLTVYEREKRWLSIIKTRSELKNRRIIIDKYKYALSLTNEENTFLELDRPISLTVGKSFDCVMTDTEKGILLFANEFREFEGDPIVSPSGYILIAKKDPDSSKTLVDPLNPSFKHPYSGYEEESLFRKTGLIKTVDSAGANIFRDIEHDRTFKNTYFEELKMDGFYRLSGNAGDYIHSLDGSVHTMPCTKDRLIAISEKCSYAIIRSENGIKLVEYDAQIKGWKGSDINSMDIDDSFYSKAVFCSDSENIIYQKKGKEYYLRNIASEKESVFELQGSVIKRNLNGYIPYLDFDTHRRPVYIDPVSLTRVENAAAGQYTYQSIDAKIKHIAHNVIKYYSIEKNQYVSKEEYERYVADYDYETTFIGTVLRTGTHYEEVQKNRKQYFEKNKLWILDRIRPRKIYLNSRFFREDSAFDVFMDYSSVCDSVIFRKEYYVREQVGEETIDIEIPHSLHFLNYVSYSYDNKYIIISGRFPDNSGYKGLSLVYDVDARKTIYMSTGTKAVWLGVFSKQGMAAYYDSNPCTFISSDSDKHESFLEIKGRSFLTFSPSGQYMALSRQGYIPYASGDPHWGHQPSRDVYIVRSNDPQNELAHYCDHGDEIEGSSVKTWDRSNLSVASATFSADDKKLMTVSKDGVVVIRNLHFDD